MKNQTPNSDRVYTKARFSPWSHQERVHEPGSGNPGETNSWRLQGRDASVYGSFPEFPVPPFGNIDRFERKPLFGRNAVGDDIEHIGEDRPRMTVIGVAEQVI